jgi:hypothetical protein
MTANEFREILLTESDKDRLLNRCLLDDEIPYVFDSDGRAWDSFRQEIAADLGIPISDIRVVGSSRLGFSLKPGRNLKAFHDRSDIDVLVVSSVLFDDLWFGLLDAVYPRPPATARSAGWLKARKDEIYTGWVTPVDIRLDFRIFGERVRPILNFKARWFNALKKAARYPLRRHKDVRGRLYRTLQHARLYHLNSLGELRRSLP